MTRATIPESAEEMQSDFRAADLESLFSDCFEADYQAILRGGAKEPFYQVSASLTDQPNCIFYTQDYFRSALHEVAHWCIAGPQRRQLADYGYWYAADGRDEQQQCLFEHVEVWPQALELLFCRACNYPFQVSLDNLSGHAVDRYGFYERVLARAVELCDAPGERAARWVEALGEHYGVSMPISLVGAIDT